MERSSTSSPSEHEISRRVLARSTPHYCFRAVLPLALLGTVLGSLSALLDEPTAVRVPLFLTVFGLCIFMGGVRAFVWWYGPCRRMLLAVDGLLALEQAGKIVRTVPWEEIAVVHLVRGDRFPEWNRGALFDLVLLTGGQAVSRQLNHVGAFAEIALSRQEGIKASRALAYECSRRGLPFIVLPA